MKLLYGISIFILGVVIGAGVSSGTAAPQRAIEITQLLKKDVEGCPGKEVSVSLLAAGPGTSGFHSHPGESFTYVLEGAQTRQAANESPATLGPGAFIYDGPAQIHRTDNTAPVKLLVFRVLDKGKPETIRSEQ